MIISSVAQWCWVSYLLLLAHAALALALPVNSPVKRQTAQKYCGNEIPNALSSICLVVNGMFDASLSALSSTEASSESKQQGESEKRGSLTEECCDKACSEEYLASFCQVVRPQTNYSGVQPSSLESNSVLLSYGSIPIGDSETITQTEPPNRPEIAYDGEYSDQEPLTLLPTYTSPEYTNDLLILRI